MKTYEIDELSHVSESALYRNKLYERTPYEEWYSVRNSSALLNIARHWMQTKYVWYVYCGWLWEALNHECEWEFFKKDRITCINKYFHMISQNKETFHFWRTKKTESLQGASKPKKGCICYIRYRLRYTQKIVLKDLKDILKLFPNPWNELKSTTALKCHFLNLFKKWK